MASTKVGIVYSTGNFHIRSHIFPDDDSELNNPAHVGPGEAMVTIPLSSCTDHDTMNTAIVAAVPGTIGNPRCVVIDNITGIVEQVIMADASIDALPGKMLKNHATAQQGDVWDFVLLHFTRASFVNGKGLIVPVTVFI
jgi:hypothetical protein